MEDTSEIDGATAQIERANDALNKSNVLAKQFGATISSAFARGIVSGRSFEDILRGLGSRLSEIALKAAFKPLETALTQGFSALTSAATNVTASANGNVFAGGRVRPFAKGGVVASPTYFPMSSGLGLMGEAGAEAVMPLQRGPDGRLGVAAGGGARPVSVNVNIATPDAPSFQRSQAQVSAAIARAVARGQRAL
jgi:lambda family phage tail tape measure protein